MLAGGDAAPAPEAATIALDEARSYAEDLDGAGALVEIERILADGNGADRQRAAARRRRDRGGARVPSRRRRAPNSARRMHLREADEGDAVAVAALWTEAYADAGPEGRPGPYALQEYFTVAASARVTVGADPAGELLAVAALFPPGAPGRSVAGPGEAEFAASRSPPTPGGRIGRSLVRKAVAEARALGAERVVLWSRPYQTDAHARSTSRSAGTASRSATERIATAGAWSSPWTFD